MVALMSIKPQSGKAKARLQQQRIAKTLSAIFGWEDGDCTSRPMGSPGVDLIMSPKAKKEFPFSVEAKKTKKAPGVAELEQAKANAYSGTTGVVVWSPHGTSKLILSIDLEDLAKLWKVTNAK